MKHLPILILALIALACSSCAAKATPNMPATVAAAMAATQTAQPTLTPTLTSTSTLTPTPTFTLTPTPSPSPNPTETLTPTPEGFTTVLTETLGTGGTIYKLPDEGFSISLPPGWMRLNLNPTALDETLKSIGENNSHFKDIFSSETMRKQIASGMKFYALDTSPRSLQSSQPISVNVIKSQILTDVPLDMLVQVLVPQLQKVYNATVTHQPFKLGNVDGEALRLTTTIKTSTGVSVPIKFVQYVALDGSTLYIISSGSSSSLASIYTPIFDQIAKSFTLLK